MKVSIVECDSYEQDKVYNSIKKSLENINFNIPQNKKILIKPNVLGQHKPEEAITTHPSIIEAIIKLFKNNKIIIAESSGFYLDGGTNKALELSGMKALEEKYNIELINLETKTVKNIEDSSAIIYKNPQISGLIFDVDLIINVPKLKTHTFQKYTGAVKNLFGTIPGGRKQKLHALAQKEDKFAQLLVDIYQNIQPKLNIMDAIVGLEGNGPGSAGIPKKTNLILASKSAPSLDIIASEIIGYKAEDIFTNKFCIERNLVKDIEVIGEKPSILYKKPINASKAPGFLVKWFANQAAMKPYAIKKRCVKCGICQSVCPVNAIRMLPYPKIDKKICINCYCCHENCPHKAMDLKGSYLFEIARTIKRTLEKWIKR
jgi:uncharacterized protein (DUF362 family)